MLIDIYIVGLKHSSYDSTSKKDFNIHDLFNHLKSFGYSKFKAGYKYIEAFKNKNEYLDIYFKDRTNPSIDNLTFHYLTNERV